MAGATAAAATAAYMGGPWGMAIGAGAGVASQAIKSALDGATNSGGGRFDLSSMMDGSGWTVSTGGGTAASTGAGGGGRQQSEATGTDAPMVPGMSNQTLLLVAAVVIVAALIARRKRAA